VADLGGVGVGGLGGPAAPRAAQVRCRRWVRPRERIRSGAVQGAGHAGDPPPLEECERRRAAAAAGKTIEYPSSGDPGIMTGSSNAFAGDRDSSSSSFNNTSSSGSNGSTSSPRVRFQTIRRLVGATQKLRRRNDTNNSRDDDDTSAGGGRDDDDTSAGGGTGGEERTTTPENTTTAVDGSDQAWAAVDDRGKCTEVVANFSPTAGGVSSSLAIAGERAAVGADAAGPEGNSAPITVVSTLSREPLPQPSSSPLPPASAAEPTPRKLGPSRRRSLFGSWNSPNKSDDGGASGTSATPTGSSSSSSSSSSSPWSSGKRQSGKLAPAAEAAPLSPDVDLAALLLAEHDKAEQLIAAMAAGRQAHKDRACSSEDSAEEEGAGERDEAACDNESAP